MSFTPGERLAIETMIRVVFECIECGDIEGNTATLLLWGGARNLLAERDALLVERDALRAEVDRLWLQWLERTP